MNTEAKKPRERSVKGEAVGTYNFGYKLRRIEKWAFNKAHRETNFHRQTFALAATRMHINKCMHGFTHIYTTPRRTRINNCTHIWTQKYTHTYTHPCTTAHIKSCKHMCTRTQPAHMCTDTAYTHSHTQSTHSHLRTAICKAVNTRIIL